MTLSKTRYERAERAFYAVSQTFLSEFQTNEPDLYPETEEALKR